MSIHDSALIAAVADALNEHCGVLFITPTYKETDSIIQRAKRLVIGKLEQSGYPEAAEKTFTSTGSNWVLNVLGGGWVFFFPHDEREGKEDVGQPTFVYRPNEDGYERIPYPIWRMGLKEQKKSPTGIRTVWDRILDDD